MAETHEPRTGDLSEANASTGDRATGASRPARTGSVPKIGFDDPSLRPLPLDQLDYHAPHAEAHPEWHEHSDVPIRPLAWALGSIAALCLFSGVLLYAVFWRYDAQQRRLEIQRTAVPNAKPPVPEPRLEGMPGFSNNPGTQDVQFLRRQWAQESGRWGLTEEQGYAQVPVERAMDIAVERGMFKTAPAGGGAGGGPATTRPAGAAPGGGDQQSGGGPGAGQPGQNPPRQREVR